MKAHIHYKQGSQENVVHNALFILAAIYVQNTHVIKNEKPPPVLQ